MGNVSAFVRGFSPRVERDADDSNIHETCPAFWAPPLVAAEEVLLDMVVALVVGEVVGVEGRRVVLRCRGKFCGLQLCF